MTSCFTDSTASTTSATYIGNSTSTDATGCFPYPYSYTSTYVATDYREETEAEKKARLDAQKRYEIEQERIQTSQRKAKEKADELLKSHIGLEAFGELHQLGYIELDSQKYAGQRYRVPSSARSLIEVLDKDGKVIDRLCVHPTERYQDGDEILTRITLLKFAEEYLLKTANHNPVVRV